MRSHYARVDTKLNLADRFTKGLSHAARQALDQEMEEVKRSLLVRAGGLYNCRGTRIVGTHI